MNVDFVNAPFMRYDFIQLIESLMVLFYISMSTQGQRKRSRLFYIKYSNDRLKIARSVYDH